ncbi:hypothetical protein BY458DRAFT_589471 [Sporodiniella umbellata]|nr:hypothetical protein BY458DRAFT_589471 [Sporodiniella umbellata]
MFYYLSLLRKALVFLSPMLSSFIEEELRVHLEQHSVLSPRPPTVEISQALSLTNALLTKESEIAVLKEMVARWKSKALEAEADYAKQVEKMHLDYENKRAMIENEYGYQLCEKDKIIFDIQQDLNHFLDQIHFDPWESFFSECDGSSTAESIYERGRNLLEYSKKKILRQKKSRKNGGLSIQPLEADGLYPPAFSGSTLCQDRPHEKLKKKSFYHLFKSFPNIRKRCPLSEKNKVHLLSQEPSSKTSPLCIPSLFD